jgi:hypothetical protein
MRNEKTAPLSSRQWPRTPRRQSAAPFPTPGILGTATATPTAGTPKTARATSIPPCVKLIYFSALAVEKAMKITHGEIEV